MATNFLTIRQIASRQQKNHEWISVKESAKINGISRNFIYWLLKKNKIKNTMKVGNVYLIQRSWRYESSRDGGKHGPKNKPVFALANPDKWKDLVKSR